MSPQARDCRFLVCDEASSYAIVNDYVMMRAQGVEEACPSRGTATPSEDSADTGRAQRGAMERWTDADSESPASTPLRLNPAPPPLAHHPHGGASAPPAPIDTPVAAKSANRKAAEALLAARHVTSTAAAAAAQGGSFRLAPFAAHSTACFHAAAEAQHDSTRSTLEAPGASQPGMSVGKRRAKVQRRKLNPAEPAQPSSVEALQPRWSVGHPGVIAAAKSPASAAVTSVQRAAQLLWVAATAAIKGKPERLVRACADSAACCVSAQLADASQASAVNGACTPIRS